MLQKTKIVKKKVASSKRKDELCHRNKKSTTMRKTVDYMDKVQEPEASMKAGEPVADAYVAEAPNVQMSLDSVWMMLHTLDTRSKMWLRDRLDQEIEATDDLRSDQALEALLAGLPAYDEVEHDDLSRLTKEDYQGAIRRMSRRPMKGIEKWL